MALHHRNDFFAPIFQVRLIELMGYALSVYPPVHTLVTDYFIGAVLSAVVATLLELGLFAIPPGVVSHTQSGWRIF
jgi:hypothetical protein